MTESLLYHEKHKGKIAVESKVPLNTKEDLALAYTPGVAEPCKRIVENKSDVYRYTSKGNMVAVVSDGSAVLGLGNIGPEASLPVMEGKAILFKKFGNVDAIPICLDTEDTEEIIETICRIAPSFGGINLEDISSPRCFEIERKLDKMLDIPVFHDDQHGTAIVVLAGLMNSLKLVKKNFKSVKAVINGPGAAGTAIARLLLEMQIGEILICDEYGILSTKRSEPLFDHKLELAMETNPSEKTGSLETALVGADIFIGVSVGNCLTSNMIETMAKNPIVFAMANPVPEIDYQLAKKAGVRIMGTGRSDFPNQINNVLAFPGIFRGALDARAKTINHEMKKAAARAIADMVLEEDLADDYVIPDAMNHEVAQNVAKYVRIAAEETCISMSMKEE
ncbi:NAD(P)-dependent malic enzyme [Vagococcus lutrae]|uniref:NAD(P)-dependent malic enzyme n=1 Tax=Vagococcus lutrae TaxID=81947 RepID=UPI00200CFBFE|nr:malic enzyme-like NAD(P)-binding protein [Vagococcus lutrae]MDT2806734.1 malic enzyme-like NAD(P)-binding protein [Vagococcus lutrae]MDT2824806.1 malic enzyme-like NAD(P)-binding protein [Vagococcus lutrae]UQF18099.1 NAD-dependent malic enzyme [Vagococcus lutrae]